MSENLLVLGNGFDLHNGLKSSFGNFFESRKQQLTVAQKFADEVYKDLKHSEKTSDNEIFGFMVGHTVHKLRDDISDWGLNNYRDYESRSNDSVCFWDFYFQLIEKEQENWSDVEVQLRDFFVKNVSSIDKTRFKDVQKYLDSISEIQKLGYLSVDTMRERQAGQLKALMNFDHKTQTLAFVIVNIFGFEIGQSLTSFLMSQLNVFEGFLCSYLNDQVQDNDEYKSSVNECMGILTDKTKCNVLNFNYTSISTVDVDMERNIHGDLAGEPIIGIDADNVSTKESFFNFTKTFRIMSLANIFSQPILPKNPQKIIFYGHSLSEPDYSYFQSIFDYYDIYASSVELEFYYSEYPGCDKKMAAQEQYERVGRLLDSYGKTIPNHGKNLLHKLLLENRISFDLL